MMRHGHIIPSWGDSSFNDCLGAVRYNLQSFADLGDQVSDRNHSALRLLSWKPHCKTTTLNLCTHKKSLSVALSHVLHVYQWVPFPLLYPDFQWVAVSQCLLLRRHTRPSIVLQKKGIEVQLEFILLSNPAVSRLQPHWGFLSHIQQKYNGI